MIGWLILGVIIGLIIGVIIGALIWRNNAKKFEKIVGEATGEVKGWLSKIGVNL
jgi:uncharacterized membrane-anchored protein YhcB (DUF1043 family)